MEPQKQALQSFQQPQQVTLPSDPFFQNVISGIRQRLSQQNQQESIEQGQASQQQDPAVSQALGILGDKSTAGQVGRANATPNYAYSGLCLKWVDDQTGNSNRQPTAYADYQANAQQGNINTSSEDIPKGARVYFAPDSSNGGAGHVGLSNGDGTFTAATDNGIQTFDVADWEKYSGQQYLGFASPSSK